MTRTRRAPTGSAIWIEAQDGTRTLVAPGARLADERQRQLARPRIDIHAFAGQTIRIVIGARDGAGDSRVEAAVDDLRIERN